MSFFDYDGRIGRLRYAKQVGLLFIPYVITMTIGNVIMNKTGNFFIGLVFYIFWFWIWSFPGVKRLHDGGYSGAVYLWSLVPIVNLILIVWMFFVRGDMEENRFGLPPQSKNYVGAVTKDSLNNRPFTGRSS